MRRPLAWALILGVGSLLGLAVAGVPDRGEDPPLRVAAEDTSTTSTSSTSRPVLTTTTSPARPPGEVAVIAVNASGVAGRAAAMSDRLAGAGYAVVEPGPSPAVRPTTAVYWTPGWEAEAGALASTLALPPPEPLPDPPPVRDLRGAAVAVVVGQDLAR